jgi:hypothetical protein
VEPRTTLPGKGQHGFDRLRFGVSWDRPGQRVVFQWCATFDSMVLGNTRPGGAMDLAAHSNPFPSIYDRITDESKPTSTVLFGVGDGRILCGVDASVLMASRTPFNISAHTDTQHQDAASRQLLRAGGLQRYDSQGRV